MRAVCKGDIDTIDDLLDSGYDIDSPIELSRGLTAAGVAAETDNLEILHYLHLKGANLSTGAGSFGITPLMAATGQWNTRIIEFLLSRGVDSNIKDTFGFTALEKAEMKNLRTIKTML